MNEENYTPHHNIPSGQRHDDTNQIGTGISNPPLGTHINHQAPNVSNLRPTPPELSKSKFSVKIVKGINYLLHMRHLMKTFHKPTLLKKTSHMQHLMKKNDTLVLSKENHLYNT